MSDDSPKTGDARAKGPSIADILNSDAIAGPDPLLESQSDYLGDTDIPAECYTSQAYFNKEMRQLWPNAWQWACREEHLQDEGDNYVYDIGDNSVIIVRADDDIIKVYLNACTHRGTRLLEMEGGGYSQGFACPFHGWSWHLDGRINNIPGRWDFPHVCNKKHGLQEVRCERWGGFVFINLNQDAKPLTDYLDVLPDHFAHFPLEHKRIKLHVQKTLPCNWKVGQEAFMEAYHNFETHDTPTGANAQYDIFGKYVSRFIHNIGHYSADALSDYPGVKWRDPVLSEQEILASMPVAGRPLKEGETARSVAAESLRKSLGKELGMDFDQVSDSLMLDSIEYHLFPNMFFFAGVTISMAYRFRPQGNDVDTCVFDLMILEPLPERDAHPEPPEPITLNIEQSYTEVEALGWLGAIFDQDTNNLRLQQQGLKTTRKGLTLGNYQEGRIRRVHLTLEEFMAEEN